MVVVGVRSVSAVLWGELVADPPHKNIEEIVVTKKPLGSEMTHRLSEDTLIGQTQQPERAFGGIMSKEKGKVVTSSTTVETTLGTVRLL